MNMTNKEDQKKNYLELEIKKMGSKLFVLSILRRWKY